MPRRNGCRLESLQEEKKILVKNTLQVKAVLKIQLN